MCIYMCVPMSAGALWKTEEGIRSPGSGAIGVCELPDAGAGT